MNSGKFAVTASDGSLAISSNKFTVAGNTGNTVVAGTLDVTGATTLSSLSSGAATLSSTLDVTGARLTSTLNVTRRRGREQWEVCGDGIGRVAGDFVEQVHGGWQHGQHGGGGDAGRDGSDYVEQPELGSCDAVEHAGCGRRRGREQWEVCGDGIGRVAGDFVEQVHGGWQHGQHGGGGDAGRDGSDYVEQPELGSCDAVEHAGCDGSDDA